MLKIDGETYHVISLVPAAAGMWAKTDDNTYEIVVLWAHLQAYVETNEYLAGIPISKIIGVTVVDLSDGTFAAHDEYTTNPPRAEGVTLKR